MQRLDFAVLGAVLSLVAAREASACACCSAIASRQEATAKMMPYEKAVFADIRFAPKAWIHSGEGQTVVEATRGFARPSNDAYEIALTREGPRWRFALTDDKGAKGMLAFRLSPRLTRFEVDTLVGGVEPEEGAQAWDKAATERRRTSLYKEWRVEAPVFGEGLFVSGAFRSARARLILHGHGNACPSDDDFSRWTLEVRGPNAKFSFFGRLEVSREKEKSEDKDE